MARCLRDIPHTKYRIPGLDNYWGEDIFATGKKELFNIAQDIGEKEEKSQHNPDVVQELSRDLGEYLRQVDAQRPSFKARGEMCPKGNFTLWNIVFHLGEIHLRSIRPTIISGGVFIKNSRFFFLFSLQFT